MAQDRIRSLLQWRSIMVPKGILLPLEEYITPEIMPNLYALTQEDPSILKSITTPDGHIYSLPMISRNATSIWWQGPIVVQRNVAR